MAKSQVVEVNKQSLLQPLILRSPDKAQHERTPSTSRASSQSRTSSQSSQSRGSSQSSVERLLQGVRNKEISALLKMMATATLCIVVGVLHPLATESSKTANFNECSWTENELTCTGIDPAAGRLAMPYHGITLTLIAELVSVIFAFAAVCYGEGSIRRGVRRLLSRKAMLQLLPVGAVYGLGDFLQTQATNAASAPVVLVVGQTKLLLSALLSKLVLKQTQQTNWLQLVIISAAAAASTDISASGAVVSRGVELYGASLAFGKAFLSSSGAVISESLYKSGDGDFFVVSFRVQLIMLMTSLSLLPITSGDMSLLFNPREFFHGGPAVCQQLDGQLFCDPGPSGTCTCYDRSGWDIMTVFAVLAIVANGLTTGLTLKILSAVSKAVCNSLSACVLYVAYVLCGYRSFSVAQASVMLIVSIGSFEYAVEKAKGKAVVEPKRKTEQLEGWEKGYP